MTKKEIQVPSFWKLALVKWVFCPLAVLASWCIYLYQRIFRRSIDDWTVPADFDSKTKLVVVTGCDTGIARHLIEHLSSTRSDDYRVLALTLKKESADEINKIKMSNLIAMQCDNTSDAHVQLVEAKVRGMLNEDPSVILYGIVNVAGCLDAGEFIWYNDTSSDFRQMDVNFFGVVRIAKVLLPLMLRSSLDYQGRIVNVTSVVGSIGNRYCTGYGASKYALEGWAASLRSELAPFHIRVVNVRPGRTKTPMLDSSLESILRNFENAPEQIRALFGGEAYTKKIHELFVPIVLNESFVEPTDEIVWTLTMLLTTPEKRPNPFYWSGTDARILNRALQMVPSEVSDATMAFLDPLKPIVPGTISNGNGNKANGKAD